MLMSLYIYIILGEIGPLDLKGNPSQETPPSNHHQHTIATTYCSTSIVNIRNTLMQLLSDNMATQICVVFCLAYKP